MYEVDKIKDMLDGFGIELSGEQWGRMETLISDLNSLPRKEVISIQPGDVIVMRCQKADDDVAFIVPQGPSAIAIPIPAEPFTLKVYREQGKLVDVTGLDGKKTFAKAGEHPEPPPPPPKRIIKEGVRIEREQVKDV